MKEIRHKLSDEAEDRLCEYLVYKLRNILEEVRRHKFCRR
ncbi:unnamed protein product [Toxocara canis]|uniref:Uncharacterized protein n=1 Tax=Toxocara canis TaxID=6265 RepID=A0A3P7H2V9_TOXCA|nr:unnamed protein product [Toxocara canis]